MMASSVTRRRKSCPVVEDPAGVSTRAFFDGLSFPRFKRDDLRVRTAAASEFPCINYLVFRSDQGVVFAFSLIGFRTEDLLLDDRLRTFGARTTYACNHVRFNWGRDSEKGMTYGIGRTERVRCDMSDRLSQQLQRTAHPCQRSF